MVGTKASLEFSQNVFVNCPFDDEFFPLLRPLLFTIIYLGYIPRIATERSDSGEARLDKICQLISESQYSIHDLSRIQANKSGDFARMNMPFELGIEYGCRKFGSHHFETKKSLVLETEKYRLGRALSDLSGSDIKDHGNEPIEIVRQVRDWFYETVGLKRIDSPKKIWYAFNDFTSDFYSSRKDDGFTDEELNMMPIPEYIDNIHTWVASR